MALFVSAQFMSAIQVGTNAISHKKILTDAQNGYASKCDELSGLQKQVANARQLVGDLLYTDTHTLQEAQDNFNNIKAQTALLVQSNAQRRKTNLQNWAITAIVGIVMTCVLIVMIMIRAGTLKNKLSDLQSQIDAVSPS